jgi:hypothetical protein
MSEFDPSQGSHPFLRLARFPERRANSPEIRAFSAFGFVSGRRPRLTSGGNCRKSPAASGNIPVLRRLSAETGSITTAAQPGHPQQDGSPGPMAWNWESVAWTAARGPQSISDTDKVSRICKPYGPVDAMAEAPQFLCYRAPCFSNSDDCELMD